MTKVLVIADVQDAVQWEQSFRTHTDLFRAQTVTRPIHYTVIEGNHAAVCAEPDDLAAFMKILASPATAEAMAADGVKRETVKVFVLDKELKL